MQIQTRVEPPWSRAQVRSLNAYQKDGRFHEFTGAAGETLIATKRGWVEQPKRGAPVVQKWAWKWMSDWSWRQLLER